MFIPKSIDIGIVFLFVYTVRDKFGTLNCVALSSQKGNDLKAISSLLTAVNNLFFVMLSVKDKR